MLSHPLIYDDCMLCRVLGAVIAYFIIGSIVMFQVKGARGIEVVPNYSFWKDLPFLVKV